MPGDTIDGLDPEMVAMAKEMKTPLVRFGGNFTSAYHWRDGIGPRDKRVSMRNIAWGIPGIQPVRDRRIFAFLRTDWRSAANCA